MTNVEGNRPTGLPEPEDRTNQPVRVCICDRLPLTELELLQKRGYIVENRAGLSREQLLNAIKEGQYSALIVRSDTIADAQLIEAAGSNLKLIVRAGVGTDNIDVVKATERGIVVANTPEANTNSAAELTIGLAIAAARQITQADRKLREGTWARSEHTGLEFAGKTYGIIGFGNVGTRVAKIAKAMEMDVVAYDPVPNRDLAEKEGIQLVDSIENLLPVSDIVSVHIPLLPDTLHLINRERLEMMKPSAILVNTSRGGIVDELALVEALDSGKLAGAGLDVFENEPDVRTEIRNHPKIVLTPHLGASTFEAQQKVTQATLEQIMAFFEGRTLLGAVNIPRISAEELRMLEPHIALAKSVGLLAMKVAEGKPVSEVHIRYAGRITRLKTEPLKASVISGMLASVSETPVNLVNYNHIARQKGITVHEHMDLNGGEDNQIQVRLVHSDNETEVTGMHERIPRIVSINGLEIDMPVKNPYLLLCQNQDQPGVMGEIGTLLGNLGINIGDMRIARNEPRGNAIMVLFVDSPLNPDQLAKVKQLPKVTSAQFIQLG